MEINFNDQYDERGPLHKNIIEIKKKSVIEFQEKTIPGVVRVLSRKFYDDDYCFYNTWKCALEPGCKAIIWSKNHYTNKWLSSETWLAATFELELLGFSTPAKMIVRKFFPEIAKEFDKEPDTKISFYDICKFDLESECGNSSIEKKYTRIQNIIHILLHED